MKKNQNHEREPLKEALDLYIKSETIPFDVPGHKYGKGSPEMVDFFGKKAVSLDVNSLKALDNICNPIGVIKESEELMADAFDSDYAFLSVNGTTQAVQNMILASCKPGEKIILPRNGHKSAINGLILSGALPVYVYPEYNAQYSIISNVPFEEYKTAIDNNPDAKAVFVINPTYYGICTDLKRITDYAHEKNMLVLVDEAHGTHFYFNDKFPQGGMTLGADLSAVSLHKTGGSLTQSSVLLLNERVLNRDYVKTILNLSQTTSASYILMTSLDIARKRLVIHGKSVFDTMLKMTTKARASINDIPGFQSYDDPIKNGYDVFALDRSKLVINVTNSGLSGLQLYDMLRDEYNIQIELGDVNNILALPGLGTVESDLDNLVSALREISSKYYQEIEVNLPPDFSRCEVVVTPREAFYSGKEQINLKDSVGRVSGEFVMLYPPGIPILAPGERITEGILAYIEILKIQHGIITGLEDQDVKRIKVIIE